MKSEKVRIVLEVDQKLRADIKARAAKEYVTMTNWILACVVKAMRNEEKDNETGR